MKNKLMMGLWRYIFNVPSFLWEKQIAVASKKLDKENNFMTADHLGQRPNQMRSLR